jgi:hypothetical protein
MCGGVLTLGGWKEREATDELLERAFSLAGEAMGLVGLVAGLVHSGQPSGRRRNSTPSNPGSEAHCTAAACASVSIVGAGWAWSREVEETVVNVAESGARRARAGRRDTFRGEER